MNKFKLLSIFCMFNFIIFSQKGKIIYGVKSIKKDNIGIKIKSIQKEYETMNFELNFDSKKSSFVLEKSLPMNQKWYNYAKIITRTQNKWFQDASKKEAISNKEIKGIVYQVYHNSMTDWSLLDETKLIQGYTCYKAIRKELNEKFSNQKEKKYIVHTAWYCPDIPYPYGPVGNGGLPGIILELSRSNLIVFTAKKVILNHDKIKIYLPKEGKRINVEEKIRLMRLARKVTED